MLGVRVGMLVAEPSEPEPGGESYVNLGQNKIRLVLHQKIKNKIMADISIREYIRWLPGNPEEPTSTVVLTFSRSALRRCAPFTRLWGRWGEKVGKSRENSLNFPPV